MAYAQKITRPVVTVINPIREPSLVNGSYPKGSLEEQWKVTNDAGIRATWLWQPTSLEDTRLVNFAKSQMENQEFGLFLEVDRDFAKKSGVLYRGQGPWYFSDGLLLASYDQGEREKLIDTAFSLFHHTFGYYPKTVGAWWIDAYSLDYMHQKYGVIASLRAANQFDLDAYSIWGTPWSIPYIASTINAGVPAQSHTNSGVVMLQWAARDPLKGYGVSQSASLYSMQDYALEGYDMKYVDYLLNIYLKYPMDNLVVGLEGGFPPIAYDGAYKEKLTHISNLQKEGKVQVMLAKDYVKAFTASARPLPPTHYFLAKDFTSKDQSFWYISPYFQASIQKRGNDISLVDMRIFNNTPEEFFTLPNSQGMLRISEPSVVDSSRMPKQSMHILNSFNPLSIRTKNNTVTLVSGKDTVAVFTPMTLTLLMSSGVRHVFTFSPKQVVSYPLILVLLYCLYALFLLWQTKNAKNVLLQMTFLFLPFLFAMPLLLSQVMIFTRQEILLIPLLQTFHSSLEVSIALLFFCIPFFILFLGHYVFTVILRKRYHVYFYWIVLLMITLLYMHIPYIPLDRSTYLFLGIFFLGIGIVFLGIVFGVWLKIKSKKAAFLTAFFSGIIFLALFSLILFSRQVFVLNAFEMDALRVIETKKENVWYFMPPTLIKPIYKAVRPVLYDFPILGGSMTHTHWQIATKPSFNSDGIIFVPRYVGVSIGEEDIKKNNLKVIFDNGQIVLYEKQH